MLFEVGVDGLPEDENLELILDIHDPRLVGEARGRGLKSFEFLTVVCVGGASRSALCRLDS